jgi:hypothetical protein
MILCCCLFWVGLVSLVLDRLPVSHPAIFVQARYTLPAYGEAPGGGDIVRLARIGDLVGRNGGVGFRLESPTDGLEGEPAGDALLPADEGQDATGSGPAVHEGRL